MLSVRRKKEKRKWEADGMVDDGDRREEHEKRGNRKEKRTIE
jgi:hypothetical protein